MKFRPRLDRNKQRRPSSSDQPDGASPAGLRDVRRGGRRKLRPHKRRVARPDDRAGDDFRQRLQKVLAAHGLGSRRGCEELILAGRVEVDGETVTRLGTCVDPARQSIRVDGESLPKVEPVYFMLNKPAGVLSTTDDPSGRPLVTDLVPDRHRLFMVGRLDLHSEGLVLMTNDGELAHRLTHPRYGVEKSYVVQVAGRMSVDDLAKMRRGVYIDEGLIRARYVAVRRTHKQSTILDVILSEGKNREIRRMLARLGHKVQRLTRTAIGPLRLGQLLPGESRPLTKEEIDALHRVAFTPAEPLLPTGPAPKRRGRRLGSRIRKGIAMPPGIRPRVAPGESPRATWHDAESPSGDAAGPNQPVADAPPDKRPDFPKRRSEGARSRWQKGARGRPPTGAKFTKRPPKRHKPPRDR